jgi:hypothetical protein
MMSRWFTCRYDGDGDGDGGWCLNSVDTRIFVLIQDYRIDCQ